MSQINIGDLRKELTEEVAEAMYCANKVACSLRGPIWAEGLESVKNVYREMAMAAIVVVVTRVTAELAKNLGLR